MSKVNQPVIQHEIEILKVIPYNCSNSNTKEKKDNNESIIEYRYKAPHKQGNYNYSAVVSNDKLVENIALEMCNCMEYVSENIEDMFDYTNFVNKSNKQLILNDNHKLIIVSRVPNIDNHWLCNNIRWFFQNNIFFMEKLSCHNICAETH